MSSKNENNFPLRHFGAVVGTQREASVSLSPFSGEGAGQVFILRREMAGPSSRS